MMHKNLPEHTKLCPGCGTCLMNSARHCSVCGYVFLEVVDEPVHRPKASNPLQVTLSVPGFVALVLLLLIMNTVFILGWQKRSETKVLVRSVNATATFEATTFVSPTNAPTETRTSAPPTNTVEPEIMYTVVSGDSCLSISARFQVSLDSLAHENDDLNCDLLNIGTVLTIPRPTATPEPTVTPPPPGS
jgi:LysM repeat protein